MRCSFTPVPRHVYNVGFPEAGRYEEIMNSDAKIYGGTAVDNIGGVPASGLARHGFACSLRVTAHPMGAVILRWSA